MQVAQVTKQIFGRGWLAAIGLLLAQDAFAYYTNVSVAHISPNPSTLGQTVTFSVSLYDSCSNLFCYDPTGSISIMDNGTVLCTVELGTTFSCDASVSVAGQHPIQAQYSGDSNYTGSSSAISQLTVETDSAMSVTSSLNPSFYAQTLTFTAHVGPLSGGSISAPTGQVVFKADGSAIGSAALNGSGTATYTASPYFGVGNHTITASYAGDSVFHASDGSLSGNPQVIMPNTLTLVASNANPSSYAQPVTFTATVSPVFPNHGTPNTTGSVGFFDGDTLMGGNHIDGSGAASLTVSTLTIGNHTITAKYSPGSDSATFSGSTGNMTQEVTDTVFRDGFE